jgi:hypothetical protein
MCSRGIFLWHIAFQEILVIRALHVVSLYRNSEFWSFDCSTGANRSKTKTIRIMRAKLGFLLSYLPMELSVLHQPVLPLDLPVL